jgi:hypothetical protein
VQKTNTTRCQDNLFLSEFYAKLFEAIQYDFSRSSEVQIPEEIEGLRRGMQFTEQEQEKEKEKNKTNLSDSNRTDGDKPDESKGKPSQEKPDSESDDAEGQDPVDVAFENIFGGQV